MAWESPQGLKITLRAAADLSTHQFKFVKTDTNGDVVLCSATTDIPIGVLQNKPQLGQEAEVLVSGVTKLVGAAGTAVGTLLATNATGLAAVVVAGTDTTRYVVARTLQPTNNANELITAVLNAEAPTRAA